MAAKNTQPVLLTLGTCNRRAGISVLAESFLEHHPSARVFVCLVDQPHPEMPRLNFPAETFHANTLTLPGGLRFFFKYDAFELCCALKPFAMQHLLNHYGFSRLVYLDSDILVTHPLWVDLEDAWEKKSILLTPHLLRLPSELPFDLQRSFVQHGAYNGGFLALEKSDDSLRFLRWWSDMLKTGCTFDPMNNIYVDQRWLDLAAASSNAVGILRDPGLNVAYWNLHERALQPNGIDNWTVNGRPLKFFHFSGYDRKTLSTKTICTDANAITLAEQYGRLLHQAQNSIFEKFSYGWDFYCDGTKISKKHRDLILAEHPDLAEIADPFILPSIPQAWRVIDRVSDLSSPFRIGQRYENSAILLQRLYQHPVLGKVWKIWTRFVNPSLRPHLPPNEDH